MYQIITEQIIKLSSDDQEKLFELLLAHAELFEKIIPDSPLILHIKGQVQLNHPVATAFDEWKSRR